MESTRPYLMLCAFATLAPLVSIGAPEDPAPGDFTGWPTHFEGRVLRKLPLTERERHFESGFPGRIGRFTDGQREIIIRFVNQPTRKLHPAADCFRGSGYDVEYLPQVVGREGAWSSFKATRGKEKLVIKERIVNNHSRSWSDSSSWYWSAILEDTTGPWWALTIAMRAEPTALEPPGASSSDLP